MLYGIFFTIISYFISVAVIDKVVPVRNQAARRDKSFLHKLFFYHLFLSLVYYIYAVYNRSDSSFYYKKVLYFYRGQEWSDFYGTSTKFIEFVGYPFIHFLGFTYEAMMALFTLFGFIGFIYFFRFFKEKIFFENRFLDFNLLFLFFLLPNLHFWSSSFGKGPLIFLGIGMFFYGLNNIKRRWIIILIGGLVTYHVRPHIMFVMLVSTAIGFTFSTKGVGVLTRLVVVIVSIGAFTFIYQDVLKMVGIEQGEELVEGLGLTHRATELTKATSGIDITSYSLPEQVFAFLYRPLFFDAPGMLGIIVSFENVFLLLITFYFISKGGIFYLFKGDFLVKTAFLSFVTVSIALAQISGNLGLAIRQKSQVMMLFLFVIIKFLDDRKLKEYRKRWLIQQRKKKVNRAQQMAEG